jgi:xylulokinase
VSILMSVDLGTSSVRTMLLREDGHVLGSCGAGYDVSIPRTGYAEQSPQMWYEKMTETMRAVIAQTQIAPEEVKAVSFSGQMHGLVCVDKNGDAFRPAMIWQDQRAADAISHIYRDLGEALVTENVQNRISAGFLLGSLYWIYENEPESYERIHKVMLPKDYVKMRLTGEILTDYSDAAGSTAFDNVRMCWAKPLIERLGLSMDKFPRCEASSYVVGTLTEAAARDTGLPRSVLVVNGGADQCMQGIGNGIIEDGVLACNIGTGGQISTSVSSPVYDKKLRTNTFAHVLDGRWNFMGAALSSGSSLKWFTKQVTDLGGYDVMNLEASRILPGSEGLVFLPYLVGERTPHQDAGARGMFCGLTLKHGRYHMARAVMEGVVYSLKDCMAVLLENGVKCRRVIAAGGGANSPVWLQIQADVLEQPIYKSMTAEQACVGAAITAGVGAGVYQSFEEACGQLVKLDHKIYEPKQENTGVYREYYQIFRELYQANKEIFHRLGDLSGE